MLSNLINKDYYANRDSPVRGRNDGSDRENALYTSLINDYCGNNLPVVKLDLWTFIAKVAKKDEYEFHGDTVAYFRIKNTYQFIRYGFCIYQDLEVTVDEETQAEAKEKVWDCQQIDVDIPESSYLKIIKQRQEYQLSVTDWQYKGEKESFSYQNVKRSQATKMVRDKFEETPGIKIESEQYTADHNWQVSGNKSFTNCMRNSVGGACPGPEENAPLEDRMKSGINTKWYRNFKTDDLGNYDLQLDGETDQGKTREIFGFFWIWSTADRKNESPSYECLSNRNQKIVVTPVTEAAWVQVYQEPAPEPIPEIIPDPVIVDEG